MCAQAALRLVEEERDTARRLATEALRLLTPVQYTQLRRTLGGLDVAGGFGVRTTGERSTSIPGGPSARQPSERGG